MQLLAVRIVAYYDVYRSVCIYACAYMYILTVATMQGTDQELQALRILRSKEYLMLIGLFTKNVHFALMFYMSFGLWQPMCIRIASLSTYQLHYFDIIHICIL